jgi:spoIIIJ-associated protein
LQASKLNLDTAAPKIDEFLQMVCGRAGFDLSWSVGEPTDIHADFENPELVVRFEGPDVDLLLSNRAELLLALEHLGMEMLRMAPDQHSLLQFDANDYRALRIEELRMSAMTAAERVKRTHTPFEFGPMTSRERRIIHLALRSEPELRSESAGMGPQRHVVIYPADMPSQPARPAPFRRGGGRRR